MVGGCGRVGLPLGIALAARGLSVVLYDIDAGAAGRVGGESPVVTAVTDLDRNR